MDNLKKLRQEIGLTQQSLAKELNTSQQSVYKYEHHITEPDISILKNMADVFNVSVDYLIGHSTWPHKIQEVHPADLNQEEFSLVEKYRSLPPSSREIFSQLLDEFLKNHSAP